MAFHPPPPILPKLMPPISNQIKAVVTPEERKRLDIEYKAAMASIKQLANDHYQAELEKERNQWRWIAGEPMLLGWWYLDGHDQHYPTNQEPRYPAQDSGIPRPPPPRAPYGGDDRNYVPPASAKVGTGPIEKDFGMTIEIIVIEIASHRTLEASEIGSETASTSALTGSANGRENATAIHTLMPVASAPSALHLPRRRMRFAPPRQPSSAQRELPPLFRGCSPLVGQFHPPHLPAPNNSNDDARGAVTTARGLCWSLGAVMVITGGCALAHHAQQCPALVVAVVRLGSWSALFGALWDNFISIDADFDSEYNRKIFILIAAMVEALDANY
ncbi:hypothetical protein BJ912DRAFT_931859 [Pholiota molesta]|nr:hypothetical protein BJ912DRAFT_931859 [Pholiota molesta]